MANRFIDSIQHYDTANIGKKYNEVSGSWTVQAGAGPRGNPALSIGSDGFGIRYVGRTFNDQDTWIVGMRAKLSGFGDGNFRIIKLHDGIAGQDQLWLTVQTDGRLRVKRGDGTILGSATTKPLFTNVWAYIELKAVIHPSAGIVQARVDNTLCINLSGINTRVSGNNSASQIRLGSGGGVDSGLFCDFYVHDGQGVKDIDFWGDTEIDYYEAAGDGSASDFTTVGSGNHFENVDELVPDLADYNKAATPGDTDYYTFNAITGSPIIRCIQSVALMQKDDGNDRRVQLATKSGGTDYQGTAQDVPSSPGYLLEQWADNPDTSADWTATEANASEFGLVVEN